MTGSGTDEVTVKVTGYRSLVETLGHSRVQVASFVERELAKALAEKLKDRYTDTRIVAVDLPAGQRYRVQVGRFSSESQVSAVARELNARFHVESVVVRDDVQRLKEWFLQESVQGIDITAIW